MGDVDVVKVLQTGLFGFVFLMALLSYRATRLADTASDGAIRKAKNFSWITVILVMIAGGFQVLDKWLFQKPPSEALELCRDSFSRLDSLSNLPSVTRDDLKNQIEAHVAVCEDALRDAVGN